MHQIEIKDSDFAIFMKFSITKEHVIRLNDKIDVLFNRFYYFARLI